MVTQITKICPFEEWPKLELLPSTGVTRSLQYYELIRHPKAPDPFVTENLFHVRALTRTPEDFPCCHVYHLCTCCCQYPAGSLEPLGNRYRSQEHLSLDDLSQLPWAGSLGF